MARRSARALVSLVSLASLAVAVAGVRPARADEPAAAPPPPRVADQELGVRVGLGLNAVGMGPGGFTLAGSWLYRLTDTLWFDARASFTLGSGGAICTFPASGTARCDSAVASGSGVDLLGGVRFFLPSDGPIVPWVGGGVGGTLATFSGDALTGPGIPLWGAVGARARVNDFLSLGGEANLGFGAIHYDRQLGWRGFGRLAVLAGVDFAL